MFARIVVPIDFSPSGDRALEYARALADPTGASLHLLHVLPNLFLRAVVNDPRDLETGALNRVQDQVSPEDRRRFRVVPVVQQSDDAADEIVTYAGTQDADLIVIGPNGRGRTPYELTGRVAEKVIRTAPCPVLTVPPTGACARALEHILVPIDFSDASDAALYWARRTTTRLGASLHLLHVLDDPWGDVALGSEVFVAESPENRAARLSDAQRRLEDRITANDRARLHATAEVACGPAARTIIDYAARSHVDAIVMGTHGRTGVAHLLLGSVAEQVVRKSPCPVVTVRNVRAHAEMRKQRARALSLAFPD